LLSEQQKEDEEIAQPWALPDKQLRNIRKRFFQDGLEEAIKEKQHPGVPPKLDIKGETIVIKLGSTGNSQQRRPGKR